MLWWLDYCRSIIYDWQFIEMEEQVIMEPNLEPTPASCAGCPVAVGIWVLSAWAGYVVADGMGYNPWLGALLGFLAVFIGLPYLIGDFWSK